MSFPQPQHIHWVQHRSRGLSRSGESQSMNIPEEEAAVASLGTQSIQSFINTQTQTSEERALPALPSLPCKGSQCCPCLWVCGLEVLTRLCPSEQYTFSSGDFSLSRGFLHWSSGGWGRGRGTMLAREEMGVGSEDDLWELNLGCQACLPT